MNPETEGKAGHTATPWRLNEEGNAILGIGEINQCETMEEDQVNAAFICKAVNRDHLFDELVANLKETRDAAAFLMRLLAQADTKLISKLDHRFDGFGKRADEIIAKAEAQS